MLLDSVFDNPSWLAERDGVPQSETARAVPELCRYLTVPRPAVALNLRDATDVHLSLAPQVALRRIAQLVHLVTDVRQILLAEVTHPTARLDPEIARHLLGTAPPDAVDRRETDFHAEIVRNVDACDDCHGSTSI